MKFAKAEIWLALRTKVVTINRTCLLAANGVCLESLASVGASTMMTLRFVIPAFVLLLSLRSQAAELPPDTLPIPQVIDMLVDAKLTEENVTPAPQADDLTIVRRLTLDLLGRIPTVGESDAYLASKDADKRTKLVDRLIASPAFARYQAILFDVMLNERPGSGGKNGSLRDYLLVAMKENRQWDRMFREMMLPDEAMKGSTEFLRPRLTDADKLTNEVSVSFFGVNVSCAQCHDHPLVKDWTQDHFFGMKSFLTRTYDASGFIAERDSGVVKFKPTKGPERAAKLMFLTGAIVETDTLREPNKDEQKREKEVTEKAKSAKLAPGVPAFSARAKLVQTALQPKESVYFAKSIVNRLWHRLFGLGIVMPLDQMHSENPPTHPELLEWLARDMAAHKYDLQRLIRGIAISKAYSRSSQYPSDTHPDVRTFAVARLRPLTPQQLGTSLKIATTDPKTYDALKPQEFEQRIEQAESAGRGIAAMIAQPTDTFQIGVSEALFFSNGERVMKELLIDGGGSLLGRAKLEKTPAETVKLFIHTALGRPATDDEIRTLASYLTSRNDRLPEAQRQVLWALATCPEFRFNH